MKSFRISLTTLSRGKGLQAQPRTAGLQPEDPLYRRGGEQEVKGLHGGGEEGSQAATRSGPAGGEIPRPADFRGLTVEGRAWFRPGAIYA